MDIETKRTDEVRLVLFVLSVAILRMLTYMQLKTLLQNTYTGGKLALKLRARNLLISINLRTGLQLEGNRLRLIRRKE